jgi:predicted AAA+ superfamily ATPase
MVFSDYSYFSMDNALSIEEIRINPIAFLRKYAKQGAIFDEAHYYPELFKHIKVVADEMPDARFVLTGSSNFMLLEKITESLAGRAALLTLLPLSLAELTDFDTSNTDTLIVKGGYPAIWSKNITPRDLISNYYNTYIERDMRQIIKVMDLSRFQTFIRLCAGRTGSEFSADSLANEIGVSYHTVQHWLSVLEASYVVFRLHPFYKNVGKRLIKTPKLYFYDTALACFLLGIENENHLETHPLRGMLFENYVVLELLKNRYNAGKDNNLLFYRDKSQREIDIVQDFGATCRAFEIKSATAFRPDFLNNLKYLKSLLGDALVSTQVIYDGNSIIDIQENGVVNFRNVEY